MPKTSVRITINTARDNETVLSTIKLAAKNVGMGLVKQTQLMTAASEIVTNILKYAGSGEMVVQSEGQDRRGKITIIAVDKGPGIANLDNAMKKGFSTGNTLGIGLPGARNLCDEFQIVSELGQGTVVTFSKWAKDR